MCITSYCERWDSPRQFYSDGDFFRGIELDQALESFASCLAIFYTNVHNSVMSSGERSKWHKMVNILCLDGLILTTIPLVAVAEAAVRLAIAVITMPLLLGRLASRPSEWTNVPDFFGFSALYSLSRIPGALYAACQTLLADEAIDLKATQNWFDRWEGKRTSFYAPSSLFTNMELARCLYSIASQVNILFDNLHNTLMGDDPRSKWIKVPCVIVLDALLLAVAPAVALVETAVRLCLFVLSLPLLLLPLCTKSDWSGLPKGLAISIVYSFCQIPNALYNVYLSHTETRNLDCKNRGEKMIDLVSCGLLK